MRRFAAVATTAAALAVALIGCSSPQEDPNPSQTALITEHGLTEMAAPEIIDHLDRMAVVDRPTDLIASVRHDALILADASQEISLEMPADVTYLSIAPFVEQTHECFYHSLTTCRGEMPAQDIEVRIIDDATGAVIVEESATTFDNGFIGFWVPRGLAGTIDVTADGRTGSTPFSTESEGATCITTLQLS